MQPGPGGLLFHADYNPLGVVGGALTKCRGGAEQGKCRTPPALWPVFPRYPKCFQQVPQTSHPCLPHLSRGAN